MEVCAPEASTLAEDFKMRGEIWGVFMARSGRSRRVAIVLTRLEMNGIQRMRINLAREFLVRGYEVDFVVGQASGMLREFLPAECGLYVAAENGTAFFALGLLRYLRAKNPDCILSSYEDVSIMVVWLNVLRGRSARVLVGTHNALWPLSEEGSRLKKVKNSLILRLLGSAYKRADVVMAVSHGLAQELSGVIGREISEISVIYNPVVTGEFERLCAQAPPREIAEFKDGPLIGFFGRFREQKNLECLIDAFKHVRRSIKCRLLLVGAGEKEDTLREKVGRVGLSEDVMFHPFVQNPFPSMRICDVVALSSKYEGLPNVLTEAMACGTQVVSTNCRHGAAEILGNGRWGQLVGVGDARALGDALQRAIDKSFWVDPDELRARAFEFSAETAADRYLDALGLPLRLREN